MKVKFNKGKTRRLDLGDGNWVDVLETRTDAARRDYLRELAGGKVTPDLSRQWNTEVDITVENAAYIRPRITNWHLVDEEGDELPFSRENVDELGSELITAIADFVKKLDAEFAETQTGTSDPNG